MTSPVLLDFSFYQCKQGKHVLVKEYDNRTIVFCRRLEVQDARAVCNPNTDLKTTDLKKCLCSLRKAS